MKTTDFVTKTRKNHSNLGKLFVAPDGGYGWFICLAAGCSNLFTFPVLQQFGLLFRERLNLLEIPSAEITTIINMNQALTCLVGLANGPVFRRWSFRQVALFGAILVSTALFLLALFADSFLKFLITFSILYGAGVGLTTSANSLALNTYFKEKRRIVTGMSWSFTALGPIIFPYVVTTFLPLFGVQGTVLIFSGIAMNAVCCALLLQPVRWHTKATRVDENFIEKQTEIECFHCQSLKKRAVSIFSSQYLHNVDDILATGYEIICPGIPMIAASNDGWYSSNKGRSLYGSKLSLTSRKLNEIDSKKNSYQSLVLSNRPSYVNLGSAITSDPKQKRSKDSRQNEKIVESPSEDCPSHKSPQDLKENQSLSENVSRNYKTTPTTPTKSRPSFYLRQSSEKSDNKSNRSVLEANKYRNRSNTFNVEKEILSRARNKLEQYVCETNEKKKKCTCEDIKENKLKSMEAAKHEEDFCDENKPGFTLWQKISIFFDLDLLKDLTYLNIMIGITIANFSELNFSILTPFVLSDFGLEKSQIALCMSLLGVADISVRFFIPFFAGFIGWQNRSFFLFGVLGMAMGRVVLAHLHTFKWALAVSLWIGFNKGLRTVFMALVIPSHVELDRLPSATGLHLLFSGIFYIFSGPVVGFIRDKTTTTMTLHCLNLPTYTCLIFWGLEKYIIIKRSKDRKGLQSPTSDSR